MDGMFLWSRQVIKTNHIVNSPSESESSVIWVLPCTRVKLESREIPYQGSGPCQPPSIYVIITLKEYIDIPGLCAGRATLQKFPVVEV